MEEEASVLSTWCNARVYYRVLPLLYCKQSTVVSPWKLYAIQYSGRTDDTYLHVLPWGRLGAKVDITLRTLQELHGIIYHIKVQTTESKRGLPKGIPVASTKDVCICMWNCRGIPRASFWPDLYTLRRMTESVCNTPTSQASRIVIRNDFNDCRLAPQITQVFPTCFVHAHTLPEKLPRGSPILRLLHSKHN